MLFQELLKGALEEERKQSSAALDKAVEQVRIKAERKLEEQLRVRVYTHVLCLPVCLCASCYSACLSVCLSQSLDVRRQRSLASVELFMKSAMSQLEVLLGETTGDFPNDDN